MSSKRVLATLAGASLISPMASAGVPTPGVSPDPFHKSEQKSIKVGYSSFTLAPGQQMSSRQEVTVDGENYHVYLYVSTTTGGIAYVPDISLTSSANISQSELNSALRGVFVTNGDFNDVSATGSISTTGSCITKQDATNINWVATVSNVLVAVRLNKAVFDSLVAQSGSSLTLNVGLNSVSSCSASTGDDK